jgi:hypothetical protein
MSVPAEGLRGASLPESGSGVAAAMAMPIAAPVLAIHAFPAGRPVSLVLIARSMNVINTL